MKKINFLIIMIVSMIINSCTKENEDMRLSDFSIPTINGYYGRDGQGSPLGRMGIPNTKSYDGIDYYSSTYRFSFIPNPVRTLCTVFVEAPVSKEIKKLWITSAIWNNQVTDEWTDLNTTHNIVVGGFPVYQTEFTSDHLMLDLSILPEGYYRIYLKVNDCLLYDNLVIYKFQIN